MTKSRLSWKTHGVYIPHKAKIMLSSASIFRKIVPGHFQHASFHPNHLLVASHRSRMVHPQPHVEWSKGQWLEPHYRGLSQPQ